MERRTILVTGASGFVGGALCRQLDTLGSFAIRAASRDLGGASVAGIQAVTVADLSATTDWARALSGVDLVVHAAARVHVMKETASDSLAEFRRVNVDGTLNLARQAAAAGVQRFIFISSIKVNGESSQPGQPLRADDSPAPQDAYGVSKHEAEQGLRQLAAATGMEVVVIRPVLVYGPGVKANFHSMMRWLQRGVPLPFGAVCNRRSLVSLANLVDLVVTCIDHPRAANQTFLASDGDDVSLTQLLRALGLALGRPARLLPVPAGLLRGAVLLIGRRDLAQRLFGTLQVDIEKNRQLLGWYPPCTLEQGLNMTARSFLGARRP
ncbi:SDR family oxidoreductase [Pseudomonas sp. GD03817]|uniref:UDP-glucose 4-epimerase family protein n=1 Tax=Pseudomonas TaxID=286 RepID=UPI00156F6283|nr:MULTISPECIES: SDR family oxidoreductase [Pseudomonas]MCE0991755.1 SDR family oxidoreductase [Pseudomonas alloputida]MDH1403527.1 SDR family oxidoreductase [Pseudomonas sp. GD03730]MDH1776206.1 SDR family oxidoreductase [Pseudomonas sp. GD03817]QKL08910.1 NAD-dependent epimerase/dehydratase family protein [Pseudomonas putida]WNI07098.1 SDR family oxidoreductase [Pseudomonas putida]